jgi:hypothetical protein
MAPISDYDTPGGKSAQTETLTVTVDASGNNSPLVGLVNGDEVEVKEVTLVDSDEQGYEFNVTLNGNDVFSGEQSPSAEGDSFTPDQNTRFGGTGGARVAIDISSTDSGATDEEIAVEVEYR